MTRPTIEATPVRIGPGAAGRLMTPGEFDALPDDRWVEGYRYELIRGVLVVSPPPSMAEREPNDELGYLLRDYRDRHPLGSSLDATAPEQTIATGAGRRRCDRAIWAGLGRMPEVGRDVPTIAVEFVSSRRRDATRDYETKRDEYREAGVAEYWVIDRFHRIMTVHSTADGVPVAWVVAESESFETPRLPGFVLPLARLLGRADLWPTTNRRRRPPA